MREIGILGGTFDPPHLGHLLIAEEVRRAKELDEIWFIPTNTPPHKEDTTTSADHRTSMIQLAIDSHPSFKLNDMELKREGKSYTYDTIQELTDLYPSHTFYFIIGGDMVEFLPKWHRIDELLEMITFIGVSRPGYSLQTSYPVDFVDIPTIQLSSTILRERLQNREWIRYLLPDSVMQYVREHQLYGFGRN
ncbi:nicotinate-nucleotide adenylyltransferase [Oceanobacillus iheyensis HTE831]|uniref:Probable nicotinate-nucleotide adenylyltransferase n=1 Tax=Oceanobacillus iheyensis (strain DSM 14371 / CIP 107618 / JCM 11309 / KCTC 3954 / HTE831) TaxID=221109 RepID=NADD_OCEIH|nr:nicotinate-nucleotide adenylyltransferase [Oceanobacillus iheyensis]Q8EPV1.1 RecName: Full=Probable nicotinate-nucleotide adenylyltransferase; AltName: Full=Deamido-NAD(+) diphosphorylase; AltName: Full=Deamido-NAD(+) pyrophosphorylase; AltName: Full=Nicotinate mononucleotide adenylyltransferase; Short=NaMN adenylyltransferase [Oceanobacillus iheyensis HTE831]BAC13941.1 nicotinate-nucleotide adenylyltransferase [Oceanobacillus iheyensis HTE831]